MVTYLGGNFREQTDAVISQANPTSGTQYTVLEVHGCGRLRFGQASVTWTGQPDPLELHVTVDTKTVTFTKATPVSATDYWTTIHMYSANAGSLDGTAENAGRQSYLYDFVGYCKVLAETTGGTTQNLSARVVYAVK